MTHVESPKFDIRIFQDRLEPAKEKNKYICPVCGGNNLSIVPETGKYSCFNNCECHDIREAVSPWAERKKGNCTPSPRKDKKKTVNSRPAQIPEDFTLIKLPEPAIAIPQPQRLTAKPPKGIPGHATQITYDYSPTQWVVRYEWADYIKEKGKDKSFRQYHSLSDGTPEMKKGDEPWKAYRISEAIAASKLVQGTPALLQHEGEGCVEIGRAHGLAGITFQGSCWDKKSILPMYRLIKDSGIWLIIFLHDADDAGLKKLQTCLECAAEVGIALIGINPHDICPGLPYKSSDIKEILEQMEVPEFILRLEREIHAAVALEEYESESNDTANASALLSGGINEEGGGKVAKRYDAFKAFYGDRVSLNTLKGEIEVDKKEFDIAGARLKISQDLSLDTSLADAQLFFRHLASENKYDPFIDFLDQCGVSFRPTREATDLLPYDVAVLETVLMKKLGDILRIDDKLSLSFVVKTIVAIVRRSREPGCQHRTVLIFHGAQNIGKSMFWRGLAGDEFFGDDYMGTNDKDDIMRLHRKRVHEISEIDSVYKKADAAQLKANISRQVDLFRLPYAPTTKEVPRATVIVGSTNAHDPLRDPTGDTRFWMVHLREKVDLALLKHEREAIWAIADILYKHGYETFLDDSQQALSNENNKDYRDTEQVDEILLARLQLPSFDGGWRSPVTLQESMDIVFPSLVGTVGTRNDQRRVTDALRRIGYERDRQRVNGKVTAVWVKIPTVTVDLARLQHGNSAVTSAVQAFEPPVTPVTSPNQSLFNLENEGSSYSSEHLVTVNSVEFEVGSGYTVTNAQNPLATTVTLELPCRYPTQSAVTVDAEQTAIAIEDPHNDNYEPKVGNEVVITNGLIASSIGERHIIAGVLSNKGIQVKYMGKNVAGKNEEKAANLGRDDYAPAMKQAT